MVLWAVDWFKGYGRYKLFFGSIDSYCETNTFQQKKISSMQIVGATGLGGLWALATESKFEIPILYFW